MKFDFECVGHLTNSNKLAPYSDCIPLLRNGIESFNKALTDSYSLTCRRYSIFTLLRKYVDRPVEIVLSEYFKEKEREELSGFVPSKCGRRVKTKYKNEIDHTRPAHSYVESNVAYWENQIRLFLTRNNNQLMAIRSQENVKNLLSTLNALFHLLSTLGAFHSKSFKSYFEANGDFTIRRKKTVKSKYPFPSGYCDLCWRELERNYPKDSKKLNVANYRSYKYCTYHNPSNPKTRNQYEKDLRYKIFFHHELMYINQPNNSNYIFPPKYYLDLDYLDYPEHRKAAYDIVHSGLHHKGRKRVQRLMLVGKTNTEIARELGISNPAVSKTVKFIKNKINELRRTVYIDPDFGKLYVD